MDLRSGYLECKVDLDVVVDMLRSYKRKNTFVSFKQSCIHRFLSRVVVQGESRELLKLCGKVKVAGD